VNFLHQYLTLRGNACHWPGVGWVVGLVACTAFALVSVALPSGAYAPLAAAVVCTIATVLLTGAFHEDALVRFAQSFEHAQALPGRAEHAAASFNSHGAMAIVLALLLKIALLAVLAADSPTAVLAALFTAHAVSRFGPVALMRLLGYVGDADTYDGKRFANPLDPKTLAIAALWCIVPLAVAVVVQPPGFAVIGLVFGGLSLLAMKKLLAHRLNGFSADALGAAQQVCEIAFYLGAAVGLGIAIG
jgi:adenosylcobinamide-GDP ribazoletransferase